MLKSIFNMNNMKTLRKVFFFQVVGEIASLLEGDIAMVKIDAVPSKTF